MAEINTLDLIDVEGENAFEGLIAKGVLMMLFQMVRDGSDILCDTSENLLNGYKLGGFNSSGETVDSEELQDQLSGVYKAFISGSIDPGDFTINATFDPDKGPIKLVPMRHSRVVTPQFVLLLATTCNEADKLDVWMLAGVNYLGGREIKGDLGKSVGTSFKCKITGKPKVGTKNCDASPLIFTVNSRRNNGKTSDFRLHKPFPFPLTPNF
jgi:hypothetical protein